MPYINVSVTNNLDYAQEETLKKGFADIIGLLPGKTERVLMIGIESGKTMFFGGERRESCAYVDVRLYGSCAVPAKTAFTEAVFALFQRELNIAQEEMFVSLLEYDNWGKGGTLL